jgi:Protein phosphatase 2C
MKIMKSINYHPQFGVDVTEGPICKFPAVAVSRDHKPDQSDERQRIEDAGGFVMWAGTSLILL